MYSGGDSSGEGVNSRNQFNWQMTSQTSCNINSGGSIDWASLAQQWIQMKDSGAGLPDTPPPPVISANIKPIIKTTKFDEQGEADMEVEKDDEPEVVEFVHNSTPPPSGQPGHIGHWFPSQPDAVAYLGAAQQNQWTTWPTRVSLPPPILHVPLTTESLTPPIGKDVKSTTPPLQSLAKNSNDAAMLPNKDAQEPPPMDAAKRKILPAWIREGLEKMEREKLKQLDRVHKDSPTVAGTTEGDVNNKFKTMVKSSTTEMEGESSGNEDDPNETQDPDVDPPYNDNDSDNDAVPITAVATAVSTATSVQLERINSGKTYEERITDMMIAVRKTLTELLLEVTNDEISSIAHEAIRKRRAKASSAQVIRKSAIPSITGKLGLEAYADSDSENSASDDNTTNDESRRSDDDNDSEEELKANIRICKRTFAKTIEEIEERIQASAVRDEQLLKEHQKRDTKQHDHISAPAPVDHTRSPVHKTKGFDTEIGEPQPDKKSNSNGKRRKERTSRFTDNKDSRSRITTSYYQPPSSMGSGSLPTQGMPGATIPPPINFSASSKYKPANSTAISSVSASSINDKRPSSSSANKSSKSSVTSSSRHHRHSDSSSSTSETSSSGTRSSHSRRSKQSSSNHHKRSSRERSKRSHRSSSYRSSHRRDSSADSNDDDHYKKHSSRHRSHKSGGSSSTYSRQHNRRRSDSRSSRSRTRSRSRSRSTAYSSSRRGDRY